MSQNKGLIDFSLSHNSYPCVLFVGAAGLDTVSVVERYPSPNAKVRTVSQRIDGGGNAANSACAMSRLGSSSYLMSVIGSDSAAMEIMDRLKTQGVNTTFIVHHPGMSGTTYVIVCKESLTRTCIHNPVEDDLDVSEIDDMFAGTELSVFQAVHFDSRHTQAAITLARKTVGLKCIISIDAEKLRPNLFELLTYCDIIFANQEFPEIISPSETSDVKRIELMFEQPWAKRCGLMVSTLGAEGALLVYRRGDSGTVVNCPSHSLERRSIACKDSALWSELEAEIQACPAFTLREGEGHEQASSPYVAIRCSAWPIAEGEIVDTTGAGDAFIAAFLAAFLHGWELENCMRMGAVVAAEKLRGQGARETLPSLQAVREAVRAFRCHTQTSATEPRS